MFAECEAWESSGQMLNGIMTCKKRSKDRQIAVVSDQSRRSHSRQSQSSCVEVGSLTIRHTPRAPQSQPRHVPADSALCDINCSGLPHVAALCLSLSERRTSFRHNLLCTVESVQYYPKIRLI